MRTPVMRTLCNADRSWSKPSPSCYKGHPAAAVPGSQRISTLPETNPRELNYGQETCCQEDNQRRWKAPALPPQGDRRRADERGAEVAARRDLFGPARHPQEAHRPVPDLAERPRPRHSRPGGRRPCALQDLAVAAAVGDRDPGHRTSVEGALRMGGARAAGREG